MTDDVQRAREALDKIWGAFGKREQYALSPFFSTVLLALQAQCPEWQTIDSAPRDGSKFLLYWPSRPEDMFIAYFEPYKIGKTFRGLNLKTGPNEHISDARHNGLWQPIPAAPKEKM